MNLTDLFVDQDHQHYLDAARSRTVGHDAIASALDPTFLDAVDVVRAFPATAGLPEDVQNSLAQRVADVFRGQLDDIRADVESAKDDLEQAESDRDVERERYRDRDEALAAHEQKIKTLEDRLAAAQTWADGVVAAVGRRTGGNR